MPRNTTANLAVLCAVLLATTVVAGCAGTGETADGSTGPSAATTKTSGASGVPMVVFERDESFDRLYVGSQTSADADWSRISIRVDPTRNIYPHYAIHMGQSAGAEPYANPYGYQNEDAVERPDKANRIDVADPVRVTDQSARMLFKDEAHGAGDFIEFCANSPVHDEYILVFDVPTGQKIGEYFFSVIETCPAYYG